ncbi:hypothetical protein Ga0058931_1746 [Roseibaca calidilacus]|uniref:Uncharacterized protein n=1 Tax=Roseibaca calidilacus TaxID=1666912 RepID=A0ABM9VTF4_9RHOB|nr:hypothetical protein Ga0058931_1746 [Roseibaca calidilacus]
MYVTHPLRHECGHWLIGRFVCIAADQSILSCAYCTVYRDAQARVTRVACG